MRTYNLFFKMPEQEEFFIAAWAAASAYEKKVRDTKTPVQMTLLMKETWLSDLLVPSFTYVTDNIEDVQGMYFDVALDLSEDRALDLSKCGKTAASAYGVLLGLETGVNELPPLLKNIEIKYDLYLHYWNEESKQLAYKACSFLGGDGLVVSGDGLTSESIMAALQSKVVVGKRSLITYLASCLKRYVLEIYDLDSYDKGFFSKWSNPNYTMLCVEKDTDADNIFPVAWRGLERILNSVKRQYATKG